MGNKGALVGNAADEKQVRSAKKKEEAAADQDIKDVQYILSTRQGRRFYWRLLSFCNVFSLSFRGNAHTSHTFFNEGIRNVGIKLLNEMNEADPDAYSKMVKEAENEKIT